MDPIFLSALWLQLLANADEKMDSSVLCERILAQKNEIKLHYGLW